MSLRKEGDTEVLFASVSKSLKRIIQIPETEGGLKKAKFAGKISNCCTRYWNDFSFDFYQNIELYLDEKKQDIEINNCTFSFLVTGNESRTNSSGYRHELTLRGCWEDGNEFEFEFSLVNDMDELVAIVYAMIIVAESKNLEKASEMWQIIKPEYFTRNAAQRLQRVIAGEEFFKNIREKYPFMTQVFKDGLNYQIEEAKKEINNLDFLK